MRALVFLSPHHVQGQTAEHVKKADADWVTADKNEPRGAGAASAMAMVMARTSSAPDVLSSYSAKPDYGGGKLEAEPDIDDIARRNRKNIATDHPPRLRRRLRPRPRRLEEKPSLKESCRDKPDGAASWHVGLSRSSDVSNDHDKEKSLSLPKDLPESQDNVVGEGSWIEIAGRYMAEAWTKWDFDTGDSKARHLERERDHLTREVYELTAQLDGSGVTDDCSNRLDSSNSDGDLEGRSTTTSTPVSTDGRPTKSRRRFDAADEAEATAVTSQKEASPRPQTSRWQRGDGDSYNREIDAPSTPESSSPATRASADDCDYVFSNSGTSSTSSTSSRATTNSSSSWQSLDPPGRGPSLSDWEFSSQPRQEQQRGKMQGVSTEEEEEETWHTPGRTGDVTWSSSQPEIGDQLSCSEVDSDVSGSEADGDWGVQRHYHRQ